MAHDVEHYPFWLRTWHWLNAAMFVALMVTGTSMHFAEPGAPQVEFRTARIVHNSAGILLTLFYLYFLAASVGFGNLRFYLPRKSDGGVGGLFRQARYYVAGIFRGEPHPFPHSGDRKFNPMQKLTYAAVMLVMFPAITVSGWLLFVPERLPEKIAGVAGTGAVAIAHSAAGYALSLFMVVHIYLGTTGATPGSLFRSMLWGHNGEGEHAG